MEVQTVNKIWVKQLIVGAKTWNEVPFSRKVAIKNLLQNMVNNGEITEEQYTSITGETIKTAE